MKKHIIIIVLLITSTLFITSCDDLTRNLNIFAWLDPPDSIEQKMETAAYYMEKGNIDNYKAALDIYKEIWDDDRYNSDAAYGYATAYARYNEIEQEVVAPLISIMALIADLKSVTPVTLFARLYESDEEGEAELSNQQIASYNISVKVSDVLNDTSAVKGLAYDIDNEYYHGRVKSQDVWLDAVIAHLHRCSSTITTSDGDPDPAVTLKLTWNPVDKKIELNLAEVIEWQKKNLSEKNVILNASAESLGHAISILALHTGMEELEELNKQLTNVTDYFNNFINYLQGL